MVSIRYVPEKIKIKPDNIGSNIDMKLKLNSENNIKNVIWITANIA